MSISSAIEPLNVDEIMRTADVFCHPNIQPEAFEKCMVCRSDALRSSCSLQQRWERRRRFLVRVVVSWSRLKLDP